MAPHTPSSSSSSGLEVIAPPPPLFVTVKPSYSPSVFGESKSKLKPAYDFQFSGAVKLSTYDLRSAVERRYDEASSPRVVGYGWRSSVMFVLLMRQSEF